MFLHRKQESWEVLKREEKFGTGSTGSVTAHLLEKQPWGPVPNWRARIDIRTNTLGLGTSEKLCKWRGSPRVGVWKGLCDTTIGKAQWNLQTMTPGLGMETVSLKAAETMRAMAGFSGREGKQGARRLWAERGIAELEVSRFRKVQRILVQVETQVVGVAVFAGGWSEGETKSQGEETEQREGGGLSQIDLTPASTGLRWCALTQTNGNISSSFCQGEHKCYSRSKGTWWRVLKPCPWLFTTKSEKGSETEENSPRDEQVYDLG